MSPTVIISIGNLHRGDDAAGLLAAERLESGESNRLRVLTHAGDGASLIHLWGPSDRVILVDAVVSGAPPGTLHRLDLRIAPLAPQICPVSTHAFGVREGVELARALGLLPSALLLLGIEGTDFAPGRPVSAPVAAAIPALTQAIRESACTFAQADGGAPRFRR